MTAANAERNDAALETLVCSWTAPEPLLARAPWDLVLASDVLYEARNGDVLLELLPRLGDDVWLADPAARRRPASSRPRGATGRSARGACPSWPTGPCTGAPDSARGDVERARGGRAGRRRRCRTAPSNFSASPAERPCTVPSRSTSTAPRTTYSSTSPEAVSTSSGHGGRRPSTRARASRCRRPTARARRAASRSPRRRGRAERPRAAQCSTARRPARRAHRRSAPPSRRSAARVRARAGSGTGGRARRPAERLQGETTLMAQLTHPGPEA